MSVLVFEHCICYEKTLTSTEVQQTNNAWDLIWKAEKKKVQSFLEDWFQLRQKTQSVLNTSQR